MQAIQLGVFMARGAAWEPAAWEVVKPDAGDLGETHGGRLSLLAFALADHE
jgi:hypothetical protein